jgi:transcriptional regulator with XRE-family HTH domain
MEETSSRVNKAFRAYLRKVRKKAHLTQEELAFKAELDRTYISLLELGRKGPTLVTIFRLCQVLDQPPDVFIAQVYQYFLSDEQEHQEDVHQE